MADPAIRRLAWGQLTNAAVTLFTAAQAQNGQTLITGLLLANTDSSARTFRLHLIPSGGSAAVANALYYDVPLAANSTLIIPNEAGLFIMQNAEFLQGLADTTLKVNIMILGRAWN